MILDTHSVVGRQALSSDGGSHKGFLEEDLRGQLDTEGQDQCSMQRELCSWKPEDQRQQDTFTSIEKAFLWIELAVKAELCMTSRSGRGEGGPRCRLLER